MEKEIADTASTIVSGTPSVACAMSSRSSEERLQSFHVFDNESRETLPDIQDTQAAATCNVNEDPQQFLKESANLDSKKEEKTDSAFGRLRMFGLSTLIGDVTRNLAHGFWEAIPVVAKERTMTWNKGILFIRQLWTVAISFVKETRQEGVLQKTRRTLRDFLDVVFKIATDVAPEAASRVSSRFNAFPLQDGRRRLITLPSSIISFSNSVFSKGCSLWLTLKLQLFAACYTMETVVLGLASQFRSRLETGSQMIMAQAEGYWETISSRHGVTEILSSTAKKFKPQTSFVELYPYFRQLLGGPTITLLDKLISKLFLTLQGTQKSKVCANAAS